MCPLRFSDIARALIWIINVTFLKITEAFQSNKLCKMKKRDSHTEVAKRLQLARDLKGN
jgi:hypothetical protein